VVRVPPVFRGVAKNVLPQLFRACVAHATAHVALTRTRFAIGSLKPLQMALIGLVEDARVEALAMRDFPGLRRLWAPFHVAEPSGVITAPTLLARLARALFDPDYADPDGFVEKGRALFAAEMHRLDDVFLSRRIGGLLGNDLGQMRVQFNARTYVIEPVYRDDGLGLWDFGEQMQAPDDVEVMVDAARIERRDEADNPDRRRDEAEPTPNAVGRARERTADERGPVIATYPEWDRDAGTERPDWTTVRAAPVWPGDAGAIDTALDTIPAVRARVRRLVRGAKIGRYERLKRRSDGPELDLDAALDAAIALRADDLPDERVFRTMARRKRDLSVMILLDASESTRDRVLASGVSVLDVERLAVATLAEALAALNDPFALRAFASAGREDVRVFRLKDFGEPYDAVIKARLAHLEPHLSTRLGTALRHAGAEIASERGYRKLILVLTDGEPSDIDVVDPRDLVEDARRAVVILRSRALPFSAAASTCRCGVWKICRRGWLNFISASRGADAAVAYLRLRAGGTPISASKATENAVSRPRASEPPLAARMRPPMPAPFGSLAMPAVQPQAARRASKAPGSQRPDPWPRTSTVPTARKGPSGEAGPSIASPVSEPRSARRMAPSVLRTTMALL
jgi:nitric oxide reductase NorD protein